MDEHKHHEHYHDPQQKKRQVNRLSRVIGHLEHVKRLIENDEDCSQVLMQIAAAKSALNGLGKEIINEHISHCIAHAVEDGDSTALEEFQSAIQKYI
ncbi:MAG: metal-sensing transcriptional repressor [Oscillospiraceae bacterium]|nr:metal-sensing transcriptional repressor [Oscillospiraceae bacterium]